MHGGVGGGGRKADPYPDCYLAAGNTPSREEAYFQVWSIAEPSVLSSRE